MSYKKLSSCWDHEKIIEEYNPVTVPLQDYQNYLASGQNAIDASGGVKLGEAAPGGVITGHVRQNGYTAGYLVNNKYLNLPVKSNIAGLSWL
tara:strand:+ start:79 stop:354 length:276 start_codon:yes stop_codon:yes gene_type:complete